MFLLPVAMHKYAILLRQHAPQASARICACFTCFIRMRSGDGAARGWQFQRVCLYILAIANNIIDDASQHGETAGLAHVSEGAGKFHQQAVADGLDDAAVVLGNSRI
jgi:hypothetical protein